MSGKTELAGSLDFISLADVFQLLGGNNGTGVLRITSQYAPSPGIVYFQDGNPIHATIGSYQGLEAIYPLFGWSDGRFEFAAEKIQVTKTVNSSRMQIVLDALRMLDDGMIEKVGPPSFEAASAASGGDAQQGQGQVYPEIKGPILNYVYVIDEDHFNDGDQIVKEGGHGRWIWVILEGAVHVTRETPKGTFILSQLNEGCYIGAFTSLLHKEYVRSATVKAAGKVQLGVVDMELLAKEFTSLSPTFRFFLVSLDSRLKQITDRAVDLYLGKFPQINTKDKKVLIKKGQTKAELYIIKKGEAHVVAQTSKGYLSLLTLQKGDVLGSIPFVDIGQEPGFASILVSGDFETESLNIDRFQQEYNQLSETFRSMIYNIGTCIAMTTGLVNHLAGSK